MKLIDIKTQKEIKEGDKVTTFQGEIGTLIRIAPEEGKNGMVYVNLGIERRFYPNVIGAKFI